MADPPPSYLLEPEDMVIIRPLLPEVIVNTMAPGPGPNDLSSVSIYPLGPFPVPKSLRHIKWMAMLALPPARPTVLATLEIPELSRPRALATLLAVATFNLVSLLVRIGGATYSTKYKFSMSVSNT